MEFEQKRPQPDASEAAQEEPRALKEFVEPEVSFPVDVLESTTFFQLADSGSTT
ncbi:MAG TPA: hypothetical protein VFA21_04500 [Pyrinomonadaceae bacterium]|jgi:hypothetical protein|nr:hypothetical protein [Pyrinomonadaceae bacterium]